MLDACWDARAKRPCTNAALELTRPCAVANCGENTPVARTMAGPSTTESPIEFVTPRSITLKSSIEEEDTDKLLSSRTFLIMSDTPFVPLAEVVRIRLSVCEPKLLVLILMDAPMPLPPPTFVYQNCINRLSNSLF